MTMRFGNVHAPAAAAAAMLLASFSSAGQASAAKLPQEVSRAGTLFLAQCGFCHGRDAGGGESGPDLTRSKLVDADVNGDKISPVVRNGRVDRGMPRFSLSDAEIASLVAFIRYQKTVAESQNGGRRGVEPSDLQTGNAAAGKEYFYGAGKCSTCHSPTGDLAGIAARYQGLDLERQFLNPKGAQAKVTVTLPSGHTCSGVLAYHDEFTVGLRDGSGRYHSWLTSRVKYSIDAPAEAHAALLAKYTDDDLPTCLPAYLPLLLHSLTSRL